MAKPAGCLLALGKGVCNSWWVHWDSQLSWMPEDFLQELVGFEGTDVSKRPDRRQGCVLFPNAFRARDPTDLSSVEMGPNMRKGSLLLVTVLGTKCQRNADTVGKQVAVWFSLKTQIFNISLGYLLTL